MVTTQMLPMTLVLLFCQGGSARQWFIIGGSPADIANHPHQGSYRNSAGSHVCGCVLVATNFALSAAHCGGSASYSTEWGTSQLGAGEVLNVSLVTLHPGFGVGTGYFPNDISVVQLTGSVTTGAPITMGTERVHAGNSYITGWGRTCPSCELSTTLNVAAMPIISDDSCYSYYGTNYNSNIHVCVYDSTYYRGACYGDSGGAMVHNGLLHGICSWIPSNCITTFPTIYTRITFFSSWICQETGDAAYGC